MTDRELLQQALDALELTGIEYLTSQEIEHLDALEIALRARLAQPEPEPTKLINVNGVLEKAGYVKKKEWVGLTDEEVGMLTVFDGLHHVETPLLADIIRAIEAKLKEKNT